MVTSTRTTLKDLGIRLKRYKLIHPVVGEADTLRAIKLTKENAEQVVHYIKAMGGVAAISIRKPGTIRIEQWNHGKTWSKKDFRVGVPGNYVVQFPNGEWARVREEDFFGKLVEAS